MQTPKDVLSVLWFLFLHAHEVHEDEAYPVFHFELQTFALHPLFTLSHPLAEDAHQCGLGSGFVSRTVCDYERGPITVDVLDMLKAEGNMGGGGETAQINLLLLIELAFGQH